MLIKIIVAIFIANIAIASNIISVVKIPGNVLGIKAKSRAWMSTNFKKFSTFPMVSIKTNDAIANKLNYQNGTKEVSIKAIYDGKNIAFLLKWKDSTKSVIERTSTDDFNDAFGVELQTKTDTVPYVDFGDLNNEIIFYMKNANENSVDIKENRDILSQFDYQNLNVFIKNSDEDLLPYIKEKVFLYHGFNNATRLDIKLSSITMDMIYKDEYWYGSLSKKLVDKNSNLSSGAFLVSFSLYDGKMKQRGRLRNLTPWLLVRLEGLDTGGQLAEKMNKGIVGNIANGKKIALKNCSICHRYKQVATAPKYMAPDLSFIGGYGNIEYLKESILNPNRVQVEDFTKTAHPNFSWNEKNEKGREVSIMPSFDWMSKSEIDDLLAFLQTLK